MKRIALIAAAIGGLSGSGIASAFTVDGNLSDWGVSPGSSWVPNAGIQYTVEDQTGGKAVYLTPGYGGQAYDAEALYASIVGNTLYIALATGHDPNTLQNPDGNSYGAGDFAIDFGKDGSYEVGINVVHYGVDGNADPLASDAGGVYGSAIWNYGLWADGTYSGKPYKKSDHPTFLTGGNSNRLGSAYLRTSGPVGGYGVNPGDTHYFYEMSLDLQLLTDAGWKGDAFNIHWTENCANDSIIVDPPAYVPEPGSLALLGLGLAGLAGLRRRRH